MSSPFATLEMLLYTCLPHPSKAKTPIFRAGAGRAGGKYAAMASIRNFLAA